MGDQKTSQLTQITKDYTANLDKGGYHSNLDKGGNHSNLDS